MKVVHISTSNSGGAGLGASRLHQAMCQLGADSTLLVAKKEIDSPRTIQAETNINIYQPPQNPLLRKAHKVLRRHGLCLLPIESTEREVTQLQAQHHTFFTLPISRYDLSQHPAIQRADLIHLHWVANFLDYPSFFENIHKPIVWTIRDENIGFGGFHYSEEYYKYVNYFGEIEEKMAEIKKKALANKKNIHMVALSNITKEFYQNNKINNTFPVSTIPNGIDTETFSVRDKKKARLALGCNQDNLVFSFCSVYLQDNRKGLPKLIAALESLNRPDIELICIGRGAPIHSDKIRITTLGTVNSPRILSMVYSASDYFVMPSSQESFGKTLVEAMACGVPAIAFPAGIAPEAINENNGILCSGFTTEALANGIKEAMTRNYDAPLVRQTIIDRYSIEKVSKDYINLYTSLV